MSRRAVVDGDGDGRLAEEDPAAPREHPGWREDTKPRVAVDGLPPGLTAALADDGWEMLQGPAGDPDVVVAAVNTPAELEAALSRWPRARLLAVLPPDGAGIDAVRAFGAGADACASSGDYRAVHAHLGAVVRRLDASGTWGFPTGGAPSGGPHFVYPDGEPAPAADPIQSSTPASAPSRRRRRRAWAVGVAAAAVLGSGTGAAVALLIDRDATTPPTGTDAAAAPEVVERSTGKAPTGPDGGTEMAAAAIAPSVVTIEVATVASGPFGRRQTTSGTGSGVIVRSDGTILTNNHVVAGATEVTVTFQDGTKAQATVAGTDPSSDLAVVKASGVSGLTAAVFADSDELAVGQTVLAVGAPLGLSNTVTQGIVSTLRRPVRTGEGATEQSVIDAVQTDAAINPGNSGGPLVDLAGRVVGINTAIATAGDGSSGSIGVGFAIPSNDAAEVAEELLADGTADHPLLGVSVTDSTSGTVGAPLEAVVPGGPADKAGLRAGDVVTKVGDRTVVDADSLIVAVRAGQPGDQVVIGYVRDGRAGTATARLATAGQ